MMESAAKYRFSSLGLCAALLAACGADDGAATAPATAGLGGDSPGLGGPGEESPRAGSAGTGGGIGGAGTLGSAGNAGNAGTPGGLGGAGAAGSAGTPGGLADAGAAGSPASLDCVYEAPPSNVADWVDESWNAQLGDNVAHREAWLLDNIMMGQGQLNLCVRWGATSAPSAQVKNNMAATVERWLNHWLVALSGYGCFPYPDGIDVTVKGWAVRPGNESWVEDLGTLVAIYSETDGDGEPICPSSCSFFDHWDHQFPDCPYGEAFHTDYWIWLDDQLPGGGGAAAVGGDWGLRMPVSSFIDAMEREGSLVIEHEMGHGFGFQDYYDWTGSRPEGGSLMVVGSTNAGTPTVADGWLLRRTWEETRILRGW